MLGLNDDVLSVLFPHGLLSEQTTRAALVFGLITLAAYFRPRRQRNPPGPKALPVIGNLLDYPRESPWVTYDKWKKQYGDIIYMDVLGQPVVILNSLEACNDLFDKRSAKYSSRPRMVMMYEMMGWDSMFAIMPYDGRWRKHRRLFNEYFSESTSNNHRPVQAKGMNALLQRLLKDPEHIFDHLRLFFGETVVELMYGIKVKGAEDELMRSVDEAVQSFMRAGVPGEYMVDIFPSLKYVPSWFPGAGFKKQAAEWKILGQRMRSTPFQTIKEKIGKGIAPASVLTSMLSNYYNGKGFRDGATDGETPEETIEGCAATAYVGGADTSVSTMHAFFLAMANYPEAQKEAQKELDALLGDSRFPTFEDAEDLPFIHACQKELLRWHNTVPLAIAHSLTEDDEYKGYHLRKGTILFGNTWSILHDPEVYPEPHKYNPWRWLIKTPQGYKFNKDVPDSEVAAFGYGRRVCPGKWFANNALFITIANVLTCFEIRPLDANRKPVDRIPEDWTSGLLSYPAPFNVSITPRSERIRRLLRDIEDADD